MLLFIYIPSTSNIYWFIGIQIHCQRIQTNSYSVTFDYSYYLVRCSMNKPEGKKTTICRYLVLGACLTSHKVTKQAHKVCIIFGGALYDK
jgi:hypothetical protein